LLSELVKGPDGEEMIRYQLTELARDAGGESRIRRLLSDALDAKPELDEQPSSQSNDLIH
jgi:hypothetical protein